MAENSTPSGLRIAYRQHRRDWADFRYCYPVVSRRSGGLSIGINLNPDKACNFDCIYCQVDRSTPPVIRQVDLDIVQTELERLCDQSADGTLFTAPPFDRIPAEKRVVRDIAFSGDGEPTTYPRFEDAVRMAAAVKTSRRLEAAKMVLITDACYLAKPNVRRALEILDRHQGEIWAKLDAGTQAYYELVNRPNYPLTHVMANIIDAAKVRPIVIQSLWMRVHGDGPDPGEITAYVGRLREIIDAGGRLKLIQTYTIARETTESYATPLTDEKLDAIARRIRAAVDCPVECFGAAG
jgi:wyosine [tRNA(Phe)-imidazoG37] synthetase (radical SAM superfamily)